MIIIEGCSSIKLPRLLFDLSAGILAGNQYLPITMVDYKEFHELIEKSEHGRYLKGIPQYALYHREIGDLQIWPCAESEMILNARGYELKEF